MLIVGWGIENNSTNTTTYWTIKNSWSTRWGELGFARIQVATRGIGRYVFYPLLEKRSTANEGRNDPFRTVIVYSKFNVFWFFPLCLYNRDTKFLTEHKLKKLTHFILLSHFFITHYLTFFSFFTVFLAILITSLLTFYAVAQVCNSAFFDRTKATGSKYFRVAYSKPKAKFEVNS